ncbi:nuclear transport factor 2 family protein [Microbacterium sp. CIAB417]|uniref:nuclear transport factor 2 family protein n=1 Tax=Microbacterium sp. CIAB417 TaxID=2860287 RepID=UPI001FAD7D86|nr:nuclear transport factor 2 family protein [Microbacterium sp. CIAB417]
MDDTRKVALAGIELLERELIVRDFVTILNEGETHELLPFLAENVKYKPSPRQEVSGRNAVTEMIRSIRDTFEEWQTSLITVAVSGERVLAEQVLRMRLPARDAADIYGFASFRLDGFRISEWHQVHS